MSNYSQSSRALVFTLILSFVLTLIGGMSPAVFADGTSPNPPVDEPPPDTTIIGNSMPDNPQESQQTVNPALLLTLLYISMSTI